MNYKFEQFIKHLEQTFKTHYSPTAIYIPNIIEYEILCLFVQKSNINHSIDFVWNKNIFEKKYIFFGTRPIRLSSPAKNIYIFAKNKSHNQLSFLKSVKEKNLNPVIFFNDIDMYYEFTKYRTYFNKKVFSRAPMFYNIFFNSSKIIEISNEEEKINFLKLKNTEIKNIFCTKENFNDLKIKIGEKFNFYIFEDIFMKIMKFFDRNITNYLSNIENLSSEYEFLFEEFFISNNSNFFCFIEKKINSVFFDCQFYLNKTGRIIFLNESLNAKKKSFLKIENFLYNKDPILNKSFKKYQSIKNKRENCTEEEEEEKKSFNYLIFKFIPKFRHNFKILRVDGDHHICYLDNYFDIFKENITCKILQMKKYFNSSFFKNNTLEIFFGSIEKNIHFSKFYELLCTHFQVKDTSKKRILFAIEKNILLITYSNLKLIQQIDNISIELIRKDENIFLSIELNLVDMKIFFKEIQLTFNELAFLNNYTVLMIPMKISKSTYLINYFLQYTKNITYSVYKKNYEDTIPISEITMLYAQTNNFDLYFYYLTIIEQYKNDFHYTIQLEQAEYLIKNGFEILKYLEDNLKNEQITILIKKFRNEKINFKPHKKFKEIILHNNFFSYRYAHDFETNRIFFFNNNFEYVKIKLHSNSTEYYKEAIYKVLKNGIQLGNKIIYFIGASNSQIREQTMWMVALDSSKEKNKNISDLINRLGLFPKTVGLYLTRIGLFFSEANIFPSELKYKIISDYQNEKHIYTDGVGKIGSGIFLKLFNFFKRKNKFAENEKPVALQIRISGFKGIVVLNKEMPKNEIHLRSSMLKMESPHNFMDIVNVNLKLDAYLNRQVLILLSQISERINGFLYRIAFQNILSNISWDYNFYLHDILERTRIKINESFLLMGVIDEYGILEENEVFINIDNKALIGEVIVFRNPIYKMREIRILKAVNRKELFYLKNVIVFNRRGRPAHTECAGGDLDGDLYSVYYNNFLLTNLPKETRQKFNEFSIQRTKPKLKIKKDALHLKTIAKHLHRYFSYDLLNVLSLLHLILADKFGTENKVLELIGEKSEKSLDFYKEGDIDIRMNDILTIQQFLEKNRNYKVELNLTEKMELPEIFYALQKLYLHEHKPEYMAPINIQYDLFRSKIFALFNRSYEFIFDQQEKYIQTDSLISDITHCTQLFAFLFEMKDLYYKFLKQTSCCQYFFIRENMYKKICIILQIKFKNSQITSTEKKKYLISNLFLNLFEKTEKNNVYNYFSSVDKLKIDLLNYTERKIAVKKIKNELLETTDLQKISEEIVKNELNILIDEIAPVKYENIKISCECSKNNYFFNLFQSKKHLFSFNFKIKSEMDTYFKNMANLIKNRELFFNISYKSLMHLIIGYNEGGDFYKTYLLSLLFKLRK